MPHSNDCVCSGVPQLLWHSVRLLLLTPLSSCHGYNDSSLLSLKSRAGAQVLSLLFFVVVFFNQLLYALGDDVCLYCESFPDFYAWLCGVSFSKSCQ